MPSRRLPLLLLAALAAGCGGPEQSAPPVAAPRAAARAGAPNVLVVVIDTLRADAVDPTPGATPTMPWLSDMARRGVWAKEASSCSSWTVPALASLCTGVLPFRHGLEDGLSLPPSLAGLATWADVMRTSLGYRTAARFGGLGPMLLRLVCQGFDEVSDDFRLRGAAGGLSEWVRGQGESPWFLLLHTYEAHDPYGEANHPPGGLRATREALRSLRELGDAPPAEELVRRTFLVGEERVAMKTIPGLRSAASAMTRYLWNGLRDGTGVELAGELETAYRGGLRWIDGLLEESLGRMEAQGLLENTLVVVTSDHGEAFGEHGMLWHGRQLYDELVRVPLVMRGPPPFDRAVPIWGSVGLIDLAPTILAWLGGPALEGAEGRTFVPLIGSEAPGWPVVAQVQRTSSSTAGLSVATLGSVRNADWKWIGTLDVTEDAFREEIFHLPTDAGEARNLLGSGDEIADLPVSLEFCRRVDEVRRWLREQAEAGRHAGTFRGEPPTTTSSCPP